MDVERNNATADPTALEAQNVWESTVDRENLYNIPKSPTFTTEESEIYSKVMGDVQTLVEENMCKFIVGDRDMSEWDSFVNDVKAMGIEKAIAAELLRALSCALTENKLTVSGTALSRAGISLAL